MIDPDAGSMGKLVLPKIAASWFVAIQQISQVGYSPWHQIQSNYVTMSPYILGSF